MTLFAENLSRKPIPYAIVVSLMLFGTASGELPPSYSVQVLGQGTYIDAINDLGQCVGWKSVGGAVRAWVSSDNGIELLPLPPEMVGSRAYDINESGVVVGKVGGALAELGHAVAWYPVEGGYEIVELGALPGSTHSTATAINNLGDIVGFSVTPGWSSGPAVLFTDPAGIQNLVGLGFAVVPAQINDQRQVVGGQLRLDLDTGVLDDLGIPEGSFWWTVAYAINELGQVTGYAQMGTSLPDDQRVARFTDDMGWELLSGAGIYNTGYSINDAGDVTLEIGIGAALEPAIYLDGVGLTLLDDLPLNEAGWFFIGNFGAYTNNSGQIAAIGFNNETGEGGVVLLTPENPALMGDLNGDSSVDAEDLAMLLGTWGSCAGCAADLDGDGTVSPADLALLLGNWG